MKYGWRTVKDSLHPVYFEGNMSAEFLRDLVCSCKGKSQCEKLRQNNCTRHSEWLKLPFSCGNWSCSTQDLSQTRSLQKNETTRQKSVHDYVDNTLKTYIPHYNLAIIYIYFVEYIFFYIFFTFGQVVMALLSTVWKITRTQLLVCIKMHQQNINQQQIRQNNCTRHSEWRAAFFMWKLKLFYTRLKRNKIFAEKWNSSSEKCTWWCC
jgi:hypothetical protein